MTSPAVTQIAVWLESSWVLINFLQHYFYTDSQTSVGGGSSYVPGSFTAKQKSRPSVITATIAASFDNSILQVSSIMMGEKCIIHS
jgi:hypothetical protein